MSESNIKLNKLMHTFPGYVEKYRERETYLALMLSTQSFDYDLDPLASRLAPHYSLHLNTYKRDQNTTRDRRKYIVYIKHKLLDKSRSIKLNG